MRYLGCAIALAAVFAFPAHAAAVWVPGNPCALLSLAEAESITGLSLTSPSPNPLRADFGADKDTGCGYQNDRNQSVAILWHDDAAYFPGNAKNPNTTGYKRITGIGERAYANAMAMAASVYVLKNGRYVSVLVANPDGLKDRGARNYTDVIKLAKLIASRM